MRITFAKHIFGDLEIPKSKLINIYSPRRLNRKGLSDTEIKDAIQKPIGSMPLSEMARGARRILIVTDDNTRPTPLTRILPPILDELKTAGITEKEIVFLIGLGTHRPMTHEEITMKFGPYVAGTYKIINHNWNDPDVLMSLGACDLGFEVVINKLIKNVDLVISVGNIVPHATTGFSGGGKSIIPGICGEKTIEDTHWMALRYAMSEILGKRGNAIREAIDSICRKVDLRMIINTILADNNKIYGIVAGDPQQAHKKGSDICKEVYGVLINEKAEVVVAEAYPTDIDLRQSIKAICSADLVCQDGGVVILVAECPEGISPQFPEFAKYGFSDPDKMFRDVECGIIRSKLMAYTLVAVGRIISKRVNAILVSPNISKSQTEALGFLWADDLQSAFNIALKITGNTAKVAVLQQAGNLLPILQTH